MGAVGNGSRDRSIQVDYQKYNGKPWLSQMPSLSKGLAIVWNMHELCLKNTPRQKIGIEYAGVMKYTLGWGHNVNYALSENPVKDIVLTVFNIVKSQKLKTKNVSIVGQLWGITSNLTLFFMMPWKYQRKNVTSGLQRSNLGAGGKALVIRRSGFCFRRGRW